MPTNLTGSQINETYSQLLHLDGGPEATEKAVYSGTGVATALKVGTQSASVDNIKLDGNQISSTTGDIDLAPAVGGVVSVDNLSLSGNTLGTTDTDGNLILAPDGTGAVQISNVEITGGSINGVTFTGTFSGITAITSTSFFTDTLTAGLTLEGQALTADGTDADIDINLTPKGTGAVNIPNANIDSGSVLATTELGYATGGAVTQTTSRTTGVTLNAPSGSITLVSGSIPGLNSQEFTLTNSFIAATDVVMVSFKSGLTSAQYDVTVTATAAGSCKISVHNVNNSATPTDTPVINFVVIKGANS